MLPLVLSLLPAVVQAQSGGFTYISSNGSVTITGYNGGQPAVTIPSTINGVPVRCIGRSAFYSADVLRRVTVPDTVTTIEPYAFSWSGLTNVSLPDSVTDLGDFAFSECAGLTSISLGGGLTRIGGSAFYHCQGLTNIVLPDRVTTIGDGAFSWCSNLVSITMPAGLKKIGASAFYVCKSLPRIIIPVGVTNIGSRAFYYCTNLREVCFRGDAMALGAEAFTGATSAVIYRLPDAIGWRDSFGGRSTAIWLLPELHMRTFGRPHRYDPNATFGFTLSWATNTLVVVEACTNLLDPTWSPVVTNTLTNGSSRFHRSPDHEQFAAVLPPPHAVRWAAVTGRCTRY